MKLFAEIVQKESESISLFLSVGLWKHANPATCFAINKLLSSYNSENMRGGVIKVFLIVFFHGMNASLSDFVMVLRQWVGR